MNAPLYFTAQAGFILVTLLYIGLFVREIRRGILLCPWPEGRKKKLIRFIIAAVVLWAAFLTVWSLSGKMSDFGIFPFNLMPVILIPLVAVVVLGFSKSTEEILTHVPPDNLIRLQSFRIFVELMLWALFIENLLPVQMTFEGRNFEILAGLTAPAIALLMLRGKISRAAVVVWNVVSLGLLVNIVSIALLSTPSPWRVFMNEPANFIVTYFPIAFLPGFLVPLAYYLHVFSLKQMFSKTISFRTSHQVQPNP
jgi:hypothetical protein